MSGPDHPAKADKPRWARMRTEIFDRFGWRCARCGKAGCLELDHIVPIHRNGSPWDVANLQPLCRDCHLDKSRGERETVEPQRDAWRDLVVERLKSS